VLSLEQANRRFRGPVELAIDLQQPVAATIITASLSWTFVISSDSLQWMGRGALDLPEIGATVSAQGNGGGLA